MVVVSIHNRQGRCLFRETINTLPFKLGRGSNCEARVKLWGIQKEHVLIDSDADGLRIQPVLDASCTVNGMRLSDATALVEEDDIRLGSYRLILVASPADKSLKGEEISGAIASSANSHRDNLAHQCVSIPEFSQPAVQAPAQSSEQQKWRARLHRELVAAIDLRRINLEEFSQDQLREKMRGWIEELLKANSEFPDHLPRQMVIEQVIDEAIGLGPLEELLRDDSISEVMVNHAQEIFYERNGQLYRSNVNFTDNRAVLAAIERIVSPLGRRIDESSPMVDARLPDGSRVNAIIPPLALKGPSLTIRKFSRHRLRGTDLVERGSLNEPMLHFLQDVVKYKQNLLISGGTGSGKTTLLNVLSSFIPGNERIVTVEDAAELRLEQPNLVSLEARPPNQEGQGAVSIRDLVKNCLRMRPDRIIVGECRGGESLDMLQAMNTGHDGSLTTAHANSPRDSLARLEVMVMMAGMDLPLLAIREQIASAIDVVVQQTRFPCGQRKITSICEVGGLDNGTIQLSEIFRFQSQGYDPHGRIRGRFLASGLIPDFYTRLRERGVTVDLELFQLEASA